MYRLFDNLWPVEFSSARLGANQFYSDSRQNKTNNPPLPPHVKE